MYEQAREREREIVSNGWVIDGAYCASLYVFNGRVLPFYISTFYNCTYTLALAVRIVIIWLK